MPFVIIGKEPEGEVATHEAPWTPKVEIPHFAAPFTITRKGAAVVEQDTAQDVAACVDRIAVCGTGYREDLPEFGVNEIAWDPAPLELVQLERQLERWEPRTENRMEISEEESTEGTSSRIVRLEVL